MLNIPDTTKFYGRVEDDACIIDNTICFDFSAKSPVTFIIFDGVGGPNLTPLARRLKFWSKYFQQKLGHSVNVMIIRDGQRDFSQYTANYSGIPGICDDFFGVANLIRDKLYLKGTTRRTVVSADCGGAIPAILTSSLVPFDTMMLVTPYLRVLGPENQFEISAYSTWLAREHCIWAHDNLPQHKRFFDLTEFLEKFTQQPRTRLDLHWATTVFGTDLLFRQMADHLKNRHNVRITDHVLPHGADPHILDAHLTANKQYFAYCLKHVQDQFAGLNILTKLHVPTPM